MDARQWSMAYLADASGLNCAWQYFVGNSIGSPLGGIMADHFGRRPVLLGSWIAYTALHPSGALAPSYFWYALSRFASGVAMSSTNAVAFTLATELASPEQRTKLTVELWNVM